VNHTLEQLISDLKEGIPKNSFSQNDAIAKSIAKSLSIKTGVRLSEKEQTNIIDMLFACKESEVSPFGKTIYVTISLDELDRKF